MRMAFHFCTLIVAVTPGHFAAARGSRNHESEIPVPILSDPILRLLTGYRRASLIHTDSLRPSIAAACRLPPDPRRVPGTPLALPDALEGHNNVRSVRNSDRRPRHLLRSSSQRAQEERLARVIVSGTPRGSRGSPHGTRITRIASRDADHADRLTGRGSRGSLHGTRITRIASRDADHADRSRDADHADRFTGRGSRGSPHGTRITRIVSRDADHADRLTGRGSRGSSHGTRITRINPSRSCPMPLTLDATRSEHVVRR